MSENTRYSPENDAADWRDLTDQLTPEQIARLEDMERGYRERALLPKPWWSTEPRSDHDIATLVLSVARDDSADNLNGALIGEVPVPPGVNPDTWQEHEWMPYRVVFGAPRTVTDHKLRVSPSAIQWADGSIDDGRRIEEPMVFVDRLNSDSGLTCDEARELASVLIAAVAEIDGWAAR